MPSALSVIYSVDSNDDAGPERPVFILENCLVKNYSRIHEKYVVNTPITGNIATDDDSENDYPENEQSEHGHGNDDDQPIGQRARCNHWKFGYGNDDDQPIGQLVR